MTTEHERPADARAARDFFADHGFLDRDNAREVLRCLTAARLALAQAGPNASPAPGSLSGKLNPFPERLPATQATEIAEKLIRAYLLDIGAGMDDFTQHEVEFSEKIAAAIGAAAQAPGYLSGKLNPFPEPGADAMARARALLDRMAIAWNEQDDDCAILAAEFEAAEARGRAERDAEIERLKAGWDVAFSRAIELQDEVARLKANPGMKVLEHKWLDPECVESGCQSLRPAGASALEIAERFRLFFLRPYPMSEEGVERAVQALAQEIEAAIRHNEARPGTSALEATRNLFQSLEGWRPTGDWTGVPARLKLAFDRALHAIKAAEARGRAEAFLAGEECAVDNVLAILDEEGWLGQTKHRVRALVTKEPSA
jgi:hypothetical protein